MRCSRLVSRIRRWLGLRPPQRDHSGGAYLGRSGLPEKEHLSQLEKGVPHWNAWRRQHPETRPALSGVNLAGRNLSGADLRLADLNGTNLHGANLADADLSEAALRQSDLSAADLRGANLNRAILSLQANLTKADLREANLRRAILVESVLLGADLRGATLHETDFSAADLRGANLATARLYETYFVDTNLTDAVGLDSCQHDGPSTIDHRTLTRSGKLPLGFLRGCGLPDSLIDHLRPSEYYSCFISYSGTDEECARRLHADLQDRGVRCWFAPHDIAGGKKVHEQLRSAIGAYDRLLLVLSEQSMRSAWVEFEIRTARKLEVQQGRRILFPIRLVDFKALSRWECFDADTGKDLATEIREYYIPDFSNWKQHDSYREAFERLVRDLREAAQEALG